MRYGNPLAGKQLPVEKAIRKKSITPQKICPVCGQKYHSKHLSRSKYCSAKCFGEDKRKPFIIKDGYKKIRLPNHPRADKRGYVFEHILILEVKLGRPLAPGEIGHHKDHNKLNNTLDNLEVFPSFASHTSYHRNHPRHPKA
jgi:hypothetical protein